MARFEFKKISIAIISIVIMIIACGPPEGQGDKNVEAPFVNGADVKLLYNPTYDLYSTSKAVYVSMRTLSDSISSNTYMMVNCGFNSAETDSVRMIAISFTNDAVAKMALLVSDTTYSYNYTSATGIPVLLNTILFNSQEYNPDIRILNMRKQQVKSDLNAVNQIIKDTINNISNMISNTNGKSNLIDSANGLRSINNNLTKAINSYNKY